MVHKPNESSCWCMRTFIDRAVLTSLPATEQGKRCICNACACALQQPEKSSTDNASSTVDEI